MVDPKLAIPVAIPVFGTAPKKERFHDTVVRLWEACAKSSVDNPSVPSSDILAHLCVSSENILDAAILFLMATPHTPHTPPDGAASRKDSIRDTAIFLAGACVEFSLSNPSVPSSELRARLWASSNVREAVARLAMAFDKFSLDNPSVPPPDTLARFCATIANGAVPPVPDPFPDTRAGPPVPDTLPDTHASAIAANVTRSTIPFLPPCIFVPAPPPPSPLLNSPTRPRSTPWAELDASSDYTHASALADAEAYAKFSLDYPSAPSSVAEACANLSMAYPSAPPSDILAIFREAIAEYYLRPAPRYPRGR